MAGILQNTPWSYGPFSPSAFGPSSAIPGNIGGTSLFGSPLTVQLQYLQQTLQTLPAQIQQLQQTIQFLPQHIAQLVVQHLIQSQVLVGAQPGQPFPSSGVGLPFQSIPTGSTPFQTGYVM